VSEQDENITQPNSEDGAQPENPGETVQQPNVSTAADAVDDGQDEAAQAESESLADLMRTESAPDLEDKALAAAAAAVAEGEKAIGEAQEALRETARVSAPVAQPVQPKTSSRELVLRALLGVNLIAMVVVVLMPGPRQPDPVPTSVDQVLQQQAPPVDPVPQLPPRNDLFTQALDAANEGDYTAAVVLLERYLEKNPHMAPATRANVLLALEHYCSQVGDFGKAHEYQRRAEALRNSHSLPEDLVAMALAAEQNGDVESMRRYYARLLLQQRQIPSSLYRHVAEAYLKLGDSYRTQADQAEQAAQQAALEEARRQLREQAASDGGNK
jgi:hypothetical protein